MKQKPITIIIVLLLIIGGVAVVSGLVMQAGPSFNNIYGGITNGQKINCDVAIDASLGGDLRIQGTPACHRTGTCHVAEPMSITAWLGEEISGDLALQQSGKTYATKSVKESTTDTDDGKYGISACIPRDATQVRLGIINEQGGLTNDQLVNINQ